MSVGLELGEPRMHKSPLAEVFHHGYGMAVRTPDCPPFSSVSQTKYLDSFSGPQQGVWTPPPAVGCCDTLQPGSHCACSVACLQFPSWWGPTTSPWRADPLTVVAPGSFQNGSVRGGVIFSCSLQSLLGCKSPSLLGDGFLCCGAEASWGPCPSHVRTGQLL